MNACAPASQTILRFAIAASCTVAACNPNPSANLLPPTPETPAAPVAGSEAPAPVPSAAPDSPDSAEVEPADVPPSNGSGDSSELTVPGEAGGVRWQAPADWRAVPLASSMRLANWDAGPEGVAIQCALFSMPSGGTVDDNVQRWLGQFESESGGPPDNAERALIDVGGRQVTLVRASGVMLDRGPTMTAEPTRRPGSGLIGAIVPNEQSTTFVKCTGPELTVQAEERNVLAFIRSLRFAAE